MKGDLVYVHRTPLGLRSVEQRKNAKSCWLDVFLMRVLTYKHYGIDVGDGHVIHYRFESVLLIGEAHVCRTPMAEFARDGEVQVDRSLPPAFPPEVIVQRAMSQLHSNFNGYRVKHNNCEHFSVWCFTGERVGRQALIPEVWQRCRYLQPQPKTVKTRFALACLVPVRLSSKPKKQPAKNRCGGALVEETTSQGTDLTSASM